MGCRGIRVGPGGQCLAHLPDADRVAYLAALAPGSDLDLRGTTIDGTLLASIRSACTDRATTNPRFGWTDFTETTFTGDAAVVLADAALADAAAVGGVHEVQRHGVLPGGANALEDVVEAKLRGIEVPHPAGALPPAPGTPVDLMAALERALADAEQHHSKTTRAVKNTSTKSPTRSGPTDKTPPPAAARADSASARRARRPGDESGRQSRPSR
ncbi:hypothetical protein [Kitasatospora purpeofusca]|uniref:hypothetical protein n=1 Tax=Kitasatospora purpeofusca TaxID=67352 RepID=UPI0036D43392